MTVDEYIAHLLDQAPVVTAQQVAKVAAILLPAKVTSTCTLPVLVGAR